MKKHRFSGVLDLAVLAAFIAPDSEPAQPTDFRRTALQQPGFAATKPEATPAGADFEPSVASKQPHVLAKKIIHGPAGTSRHQADAAGAGY